MIALIQSLRRSPSPEHALILEHLPHVRRLVRRHGQHLSIEDRQEILSAAMIGLIESASRFDSIEKNHFWPYAKNRVQGAILDELRQKDPLTRTQRRQVRIVEKSVATHLSENGETPQLDTLCSLTGMTESMVLKTQRIRAAGHTIHFSRLENGDDGSLLDFIADESVPLPEEACLYHEERLLLSGWVELLPERERRVIEGIYYLHMTPRALSDEMSLTEGRISQIHHHGLQLLRQRARTIQSVA
ncbi:sigma-70 family RNA polymerase sigma factor [Myxococcota bacterium]|nr:sigma-70 family RNA polymerase sigma factor [Myxococcota bacterium]MBU1410420.1 sigma-70 family RNA polymerase sigma factor [Myxococcota bacterium]MBU1509109.1 sigma-70 family RNA polymerase sigma factor [Myxococcota bacterium]